MFLLTEYDDVVGMTAEFQVMMNHGCGGGWLIR